MRRYKDSQDSSESNLSSEADSGNTATDDSDMQWVNNSRSRYRGQASTSNSSGVHFSHIILRLFRMKLLKSLLILGCLAIVIYFSIGLINGVGKQSVASKSEHVNLRGNADDHDHPDIDNVNAVNANHHKDQDNPSNRINQRVQQNKDQLPAQNVPESAGNGQKQSQQIQQPVIQNKVPVIPPNVEIFEHHVLQTLTNTDKMPHLKTRFVDCTISILEKASVDLHFFFVVDGPSRAFITETLQDITNKGIAKSKFQFNFLDIDSLAKEVAPLVVMLQEHVSGGHPYYKDAIFFLSVAIHKGILPDNVHQVIMLDTDLKFMTDIKYLFEFFLKFTGDNIIGLAHEQQPVYRHMLSLYRSRNKGTKVGDPPPDGLTGFNSGVMLLDLDKMRKSHAYASFLGDNVVKMLTQKYFFKGHLGDQDFFSLISLEKPDLFYVLPCTWNRQLCRWWQDKGYTDVFDQYFTCQGHIDVYHGNCNTPIPN